MTKRLHLIAVSLLFGLLFLHASFNGYRTVDLMRRTGSPGWLVTQAGDTVRVAFVRPGGPAEGIVRPGDEVLAIDGRGQRTLLETVEAFRTLPAGAAYRLLIRREGRLLTLGLHTVPYGLSAASFFKIAPLFIGVLFLVFGLAVYLLRPDDIRAVLLALMCTLFLPPADLGSTPAGFSASALLFLLVQAAGIAFEPVLFHFFLVFPEPSPLLRRFPRLVRRIYLANLAQVPLVTTLGVLLMKDPTAAWAYVAGSPVVAAVIRLLPVAYLAAGVVSLLFNYRQASRASRRKLRVILFGIGAGLGPFVGLLLCEYFTDLSKMDPTLLMVLGAVTLLSFVLVPLSFAYAIVRHQVIPIRLILRRSIRYLLVARGFFLVETVVLLAALAFVLTGGRAVALDRFGERADIAATAVVTGLVLGLLTLAHRRVMPVIDRRFFREEYDAQKVLSDMGEAVRGVRTADELLDLAARRIEETLHPEGVGIFLRNEATGHYPCAYPRDGGEAVLRADATLVEAMRRSPASHETEAGGLLLPIVAKGDLFGILSLGPRMGDLPYSNEDRRLLEAVAWQLAFAIENTRLVRRMVEEEKLRRELALASEVQRRLFPERPPVLGALDLAGLCYPAQGVGGDYYDFIDLGAGRLGLAVADVAGKGMSAALLMSIVQASLRSQARSASVELAELVASMNRLLYRSTARNSFASFFYAHFDAATRALTYVNAGHNPPMLARANASDGAGAPGRQVAARRGGAAVEEAAPETAVLHFLKTGGIVLGATEHAVYQQETVVLEPGDVLVAYTDGVTEAWSPEGEEFGEERLRDVVLGCRKLSAEGAADAIVRAVREWCREAPQADDLTLVVAKVR